MALKREKLDESLQKQNFEQQINRKNKKTKIKNSKNKISKKAVAIITAIALGVTTFVSCHFLGKNKNKDNSLSKAPTISQVDNSISSNEEITPSVTQKPDQVAPNTNTNSNTDTNVKNETKKTLADLGLALTFPEIENKTEYKNPSATNVDTNEIVEDNQGTLWVDKEAQEESVNIGKVEVDTKDDTLEVKPDGNVYEKEESYEIVDKETGNVIVSEDLDNNDLPDGFEYDSARDEIVKEEEVGKYVYSEYDFYFADGTLVISKGDLVSIETYERAKVELSTTKPEKSEPVEEVVDSVFTPIEEETIIEENIQTEETVTEEVEVEIEEEVTIEQVTEEGIVNQDGTYTIYGTTYESKADFEQFLLTPDAYGYYNGMIMSLESIEELNKQLTLK